MDIWTELFFKDEKKTSIQGELMKISSWGNNWTIWNFFSKFTVVFAHFWNCFTMVLFLLDFITTNFEVSPMDSVMSYKE